MTAAGCCSPCPTIPLPHWTLGLRLLGSVTQESLLFGLYDGLRLATIVICVGAANALANPKRLLRSVPPALYEIGSALVVAITVLPHLADSFRRVRAAQTLRGGDGGRVRGLRRLLVPVLEDSLERSLALAAGMDTRGYGRTAGATPRERRTTGGLMLLGLCAICVGVYGALDRPRPPGSAPRCSWSGWLVSLLAVRGAGRRVGRTRYRPAPWLWPEAVVAASGAGRGPRRLVDVAPPAHDRLPLADGRADAQRVRARGGRRRRWPAPCARRCPPYDAEVRS